MMAFMRWNFEPLIAIKRPAGCMPVGWNFGFQRVVYILY
jgi:hypothetical protein